MTACLTCPITNASRQLNRRFSALRRWLTNSRRSVTEGLGSLSVIGLALALLALTTISTVAAAAAPLLELIPEVIGSLVR
ncbi:MAG: hypothetical protein R3E68_01585 [Burkholderiaceae bacterium]